MTNRSDPFLDIAQEGEPGREDRGFTLQSFADLVQLFFELREKGSSLSPADLTVLARWQKLGLRPSALAREMEAVKLECEKTDSHFPLTLTGLERMMTRLRHRYPEGLPHRKAIGPNGATPCSREGDDVELQDSSTAR